MSRPLPGSDRTGPSCARSSPGSPPAVLRPGITTAPTRKRRAVAHQDQHSRVARGRGGCRCGWARSGRPSAWCRAYSPLGRPCRPVTTSARSSSCPLAATAARRPGPFAITSRPRGDNVPQSQTGNPNRLIGTPIRSAAIVTDAAPKYRSDTPRSPAVLVVHRRRTHRAARTGARSGDDWLRQQRAPYEQLPARTATRPSPRRARSPTKDGSCSPWPSDCRALLIASMTEKSR